MSSLKRWFLVLAVGIFVSGLGAFSNGAQIVDVSIQNFTFQPSVLTVAVGTTVTWTNLDGATHTVTSRSGVWDSGDLNQNQKFSFTFTQPGEFDYFCAIHPSMKGKIIVMGQAKPSPSQPPPSKSEDGKPAPPSIGADIPLAYFGPAPSSVQKELVGPVQLLTAGTVDEAAGTITLPLYQGQMKDGRKVWYILTDTTDKGNAEALGLNYSAKLTYAAVGRGARVATLEKDGTFTFDSGTVDFKLAREIVPGDALNAFPPQVAKPGSIGDQDYSPLVRIQNAGNQIYKQISFCNGNPDYSLVHDKVVKICPEEGTVTLELTNGFSFARPVLYLSTDSSDPGVAALEDVTYAPGLGDIGTGRDDSAFSAVERIFVIANGPTGKDNPQRQGLNSALTDGRGPLNVLGGIPTVATDYSPLWDVNLGEWTQEAINKGYRSRVTEEFQILGLVERGWITGPSGNPYGSIGVIVNCPIVLRFL